MLTIWLSKKVAKRESPLRGALWTGDGDMKALQKMFYVQQEAQKLVGTFFKSVSIICDAPGFHLVCMCNGSFSWHLFCLTYASSVIQFSLNYFWGSWLNVVSRERRGRNSIWSTPLHLTAHDVAMRDWIRGSLSHKNWTEYFVFEMVYFVFWTVYLVFLALYFVIWTLHPPAHDVDWIREHVKEKYPVHSTHTLIGTFAQVEWQHFPHLHFSVCSAGDF